MKPLIYFILGIVLLASCKEEGLPENVLPQNKMQHVLWDVLRADQLVAYQAGLDTSINKQAKSLQLYRQIFSLHRITADQFRQSFQYYQSHPGQLKVILDSLRSISNKTPSYGQKIKPAD